MCIPYLEPSPTRKPKTGSMKSPRRPPRGAYPSYGGHADYDRHGVMRGIINGTYHNPLFGRGGGLVPFPWTGHHQRASQWAPFGQALPGHGAYDVHPSYGIPSYRNPYMTEPQIVYTIPPERRELARTTWEEQPIQNPGSMEVYRPDRRERRHHGNEVAPVMIINHPATSRERERSRSRARSRGRTRSHRRRSRGTSRYYDRRRDSSSTDSSLFDEYVRRPRFLRSRSM